MGCTMKVLVTSDWHLDASTAGFPREHDLLQALQWVVQIAVAQGVELVLFLGDLSDPDPNRAPRAAAAAVDFAVRLSKQGIASRWLVGNHDVIEDGSCTSTLQPLAGLGDSLVKLWDKPTHETIEGVTFVALPHTPRALHYDATEHLQRALRRAAGPLVVCGHLTVPQAAMGGESHELAKGREMVFPELPPGVHPLCLNGHYHRLQSVGHVHIPGALERLTFSETDNAPGVLLFHLGAERAPKPGEYELEPLQGMPGPGVRGWAIRRPDAHVRRLVDVAPGDPRWSTGASIASDRGAIVRLRPPPGLDDAAVAALHSNIGSVAAAVKLLPAPRARAMPEAVATGVAVAQGARSVVREVLSEWEVKARPEGGANPGDVRAMVESICEEVGL